MPLLIQIALSLVAIATALAVSCLIKTTAIAMTLFFTFSLPLYGIAAVLYLVEVARDLRRHRVL